MIWQQVYDPTGSPVFSTLLAALPVAVMLASLGIFHVRAHWAAALGLLAALLVAVFVYGMPAGIAARAAMLGGFTGLLPIGWIVLNIIFLQRLADESGSFAVLQRSLSNITQDRRLQLLLIAFCFGAFFEGAAGFGTPVAVTASILIGLGFSPLAASGLSLIANTAPVAFGALGTPVITLAKVHGYDLAELTAMIGRQLPFFSLLVPFWLIWAFAGRRAMLEIWPAILVTGLAFAIPQYLVSNFVGPELVDIVASLVSIVALVSFLNVWKPRSTWTSPSLRGNDPSAGLTPAAAPPVARAGRSELVKAWTPWFILTVCVFLWGLPVVKTRLNAWFAPSFPIEGLHQVVQKMPPVVARPSAEAAVFVLNLFSATGTGILLAAVLSGMVLRFSPAGIVRCFAKTLAAVRTSLLTIVLMLALGTLTRYSGTDTTLGLAFVSTGVLYPFFGTLMGWLGVAMTGSDTASNVLFGGMQKVASAQLGLAPALMGAANSAGGVMGKMIDAQSIVVASTSTKWVEGTGTILRFVWIHSIALACLVGLLVTLQAYVYPFTLLVGH